MIVTPEPQAQLFCGNCAGCGHVTDPHGHRFQKKKRRLRIQRTVRERRLLRLAGQIKTWTEGLRQLRDFITLLTPHSCLRDRPRNSMLSAQCLTYRLILAKHTITQTVINTTFRNDRLKECESGQTKKAQTFFKKIVPRPPCILACDVEPFYLIPMRLQRSREELPSGVD